jgi:hypothetical protein
VDDGAVTAPGPNGLRLDGEWGTGHAYPSGDGAAGGDFRFRINVVAGDATRNGRADALDLAAVKQRLNTRQPRPGAPASNYDPFVDVTADGRINALDLAAVKQHLNTAIPGPPPPAAGAPVPSVTRELFGTEPILA